MLRSQSNLNPKGRHRRRGFTLIETALATIIVGVGVLAMVTAQQHFHQQNSWSSHAAIATQLGNEIREMTLHLPRHDPVTGSDTWGPEINESWVGDFDDIDDFDGSVGGGLVFGAPHDGSTPNGPLNSRREIMTDMDGWSQTVTVTNVDPFDITSEQADATTNFLRVDVAVTYQRNAAAATEIITTVSWIIPDS